jgi:hypothetical protein
VVAQIVSTLPSYIQQTKQFLRPIIEERLAKIEELGETWDEAPVRPAGLPSILSSLLKMIQSDLLMWLMNQAKGVEKSVDGLARRMVIINFASMHTITHVSSNSCAPFLVALVIPDNKWRRRSRKYCTAF